jgi:ribonuclease PH
LFNPLKGYKMGAIQRGDGRAAGQLREVTLTSGANPYAEGSCLIKWGKTEVLCTASVQTGVPRWLKGQGKGWLTAEYGMLPRATHDRKDREAVRGKQEGRTVEIQRLIGRSLRAVTDLTALDGFTIYVDCDVLVADGGTRVASISGAYVAVALAVEAMLKKGQVKRNPLGAAVAAVSAGVTSNGVVVDMDYAEDSSTLADGNFVMASDGAWIEVQVSAEQRPVTADEMMELQRLAKDGIADVFALQQALLDQTKGI